MDSGHKQSHATKPSSLLSQRGKEQEPNTRAVCKAGVVETELPVLPLRPGLCAATISQAPQMLETWHLSLPLPQHAKPKDLPKHLASVCRECKPFTAKMS